MMKGFKRVLLTISFLFSMCLTSCNQNNIKGVYFSRYEGSSNFNYYFYKIIDKDGINLIYDYFNSFKYEYYDGSSFDVIPFRIAFSSSEETVKDDNIIYSVFINEENYIYSHKDKKIYKSKEQASLYYITYLFKEYGVF